MKITAYITEKSAVLEGLGFKTFRVPFTMNKIEFQRLLAEKLPKGIKILGRISSKTVRSKKRMLGRGRFHTKRKNQKLMIVRLSDATAEINFN